ncbi:hypothetical protein [Saccharopolyspora sp. ASAGF58]|uniref:hypothetical protein n=1 Tax=Saccharopolyspora sp. ASAGF58 TaxID=2719023 RepID=UPI001FF0BEC1|nr:hypothetical protein [Saccharopolyspora sp. ASAGF58]
MPAISTTNQPTPNELIFAPVGIAHLTRDNTDLLRSAARGRQRLRVTTAAQLNGTPHLGTVVTVLTVFALTAHAAEQLNLPATVIFDALENAPGETVEIDGETYTRTVGDLIDSGHLDRVERVSGFQRLLDWAAARSHIRYEFRPYSVYQGLRPVGRPDPPAVTGRAACQMVWTRAPGSPIPPSVRNPALTRGVSHQSGKEGMTRCPDSTPTLPLWRSFRKGPRIPGLAKLDRPGIFFVRQ